MTTMREILDIKKTGTLEEYFNQFRKNTIGIDQTFETPYGQKTILYADWTASGRMYAPIENKILKEIAPFVGNTHTETTVTGSLMTQAYHKAMEIIKNHIGADKNDIIITEGSGMTGVINKLQRILGLRIHEKWAGGIKIKEKNRPVVFISHMEHHSNHTTWMETIADVEIINADANGNVSLDHLQELCAHYHYRTSKIASITACSNVTGIETPYHRIAEIMHENGGLCFVDFACSGPYVDLTMHPENKLEQLDAVFLSPHKFLGGPGSSGVVVFGNYLYNNTVPDNPGGGTVYYTNPWGKHRYFPDVEEREDGGTPAFLQTIKAAMAVRLKEEMGTDNIVRREHEILSVLWPRLMQNKKVRVFAPENTDRLGIISFNVIGLPYNLGVRMLNDRFGIQVRGGCSCAGTYGHYLYEIDQQKSIDILSKIEGGQLDEKPGWIRMSIHPTFKDSEIEYLCDAIDELCEHHEQWAKDYIYVPKLNDYVHAMHNSYLSDMVNSWY